MSTIVIIPARYGSSRFPGKPLALIDGKPMIQHVYEKVKETGFVDGVYVATDDDRIFQKVQSFGGKALMTSPYHACGTDRLAECVDILHLSDDDIVLNIQGDEPMINSEMVEDLIRCFLDSNVYMGTLKKEINNKSELDNPNVVKVITDSHNDAIYFSRYCLPYNRDGRKVVHYKHVGAYGYKVSFLKQYSKMPKSFLELAESLEQLRVIENGFKIRVNETNVHTIGIDTPEQLKIVEEFMKKNL